MDSIDQEVDGLSLPELQKAYKDLLVKYNSIVAAKEKKRRILRKKGLMCCSCDTKFSHSRYTQCHMCRMYPCDECLVECPHGHDNLCKSCTPSVEKCSNCHQRHCALELDGICGFCVSHRCIMCYVIDLGGVLSEHRECSTCKSTRQKTCGALLIASKHARPYGAQPEGLPGCGRKAVLNRYGICDDCANRIAHTCKECAKVVPETLSFSGKCNDCHQRWYTANKCSRCDSMKSTRSRIDTLGLCDDCFVAVEKCCICHGSIVLPEEVITSHPKRYVFSKNRPHKPIGIPLISSSSGQSKCGDCYLR